MAYQKKFTMNQLLDAGVHFGHKTNYWNPKMSPYIYGARNGAHIVNLSCSVPMLDSALKALYTVAVNGGKVLFVGTKKQASDPIKNGAQKCGHYYVNHRWLGGMLTNWDTVSASIKTLVEYEKILANENSSLLKKEKLELQRKKNKLENVLGGIRNMTKMPDVLFIIDTRNEALAVKEAKKLSIPVIAVVDTNASFDGVDYIIPGNDDSRKAINLYCDLAVEAILDGTQELMGNTSVDIKQGQNSQKIKKDKNMSKALDTERNKSENNEVKEEGSLNNNLDVEPEVIKKNL